MKALTLNGYGDNSNLEIKDMPKPAPTANQVLIKVSFAGLNPLDFKIRLGKLKAISKLQFPHIIGNELAGEVVETGAEVTNFKPGDLVYVRLNKTETGAFAEFVAEDASLVALAPSNIGLEIASGVPLAALTAWQCIHEAGAITSDSKVLIHAGAGAVGRYAVQFARLAGAHVTATASERGEALVKSLGADVVINYKNTKFEDSKEPFDLILDLVGSDTLDRSFSIIKPGGKVISIAGAPEPSIAEQVNGGIFLKLLLRIIGRKQLSLAKKSKSQYRFYFMRPDGDQLKTIADLISSGKVVADMDKVFKLEDYAAAFDYLESGKAHGKVVFSI
jgi:alcohol dehydrogenase